MPGLIPANADARADRNVAWIATSLALMVLLVFGRAIDHGFVNYDDNEYVYANPVIAHGLTLRGILWVFTHVHADNWHPLTSITHMADCQVYGLKPWGHHLTNILLHATAAILLFLTLREMTGATWRSAFVAALFAVHPLRVESVAWIAERKDVLSGVFFMLTLRSYTRWVRNPEAQGYAWVVTWFGLGLLSKPMLVTAPCVLLLVDYWPLERLQRISGLPGLIAEKGWLFALSAASCLATIIAQRYAIQPIQRVSMAGRAANAVAAYAIYIIKMIAPVRLAVLYPAPVNGWPAWEVAAAAAGLVLVTVLVVLLRRRDPALVTGWFWYLGMLVPVIGIMQVGEQAYADRYTYLPGIGLMIGGVWAVERWTRKWRYQRAVTVSAAVVLLSLLMALAWRQTGYWRDSETLWRHAIAVGSDGAVARNSLGNALLDEGEIDPAMEEYRAALRIAPDDFQASYNLGNALLGQRRLDEAIAAYKQALRANPDYPLAHNNLGVALFDEGLNTEAVHEWKEATRIDPGFPPAEANLQRHAQSGLPGKGN